MLKLGEHLRLAPVIRGVEQTYTYEREVEEFLRWSPYVRREHPGSAAAWPRTASRWESERATICTGRLGAKRGLRAPRLRRESGRPAAPRLFRIVGRRVQIALAAAVGALLLLAVGGLRRRPRELGRDRRRGEGWRRRGRRAVHRPGAHTAPCPAGEPLEQPVTVTFEGTDYTLSPDRLELRADVDGMVDAALDASRSGGLPTRVWRYATGGSVDREIAPQLTYSAQALDGFLSEVADEINRPARDATVSPAPASLERGARPGRGHRPGRRASLPPAVGDREPAPPHGRRPPSTGSSRR